MQWYNPLNFVSNQPGGAEGLGSLGIALALLGQGGQPRGTNRMAQAAPYFQQAAAAPRLGQLQTIQSQLLQAQLAQAQRQQEMQGRQDNFANMLTSRTGFEGSPEMGGQMGKPQDLRGAFVSAFPEQAGKAYASQMFPGAGDVPSNVREWMYYNSLPKEQKDAYLLMKRANPYLDIGGAMVQPVPTSPGQAAGSITKTPPPEQMPAFKRDQAEATATGQAAGQATGEANKKVVSANKAIEILDIMEGKVPGPDGKTVNLLEQATGSGFGAKMDQLAAVGGKTLEGGAAAQQLKVLSGNLVMMQPRMEGQQSNLDQQLYREMAGELGDPTVPRDRKKAAASVIRQLQEKYQDKPEGDGRKVQRPGNAPTNIDEIMSLYGGK